MELWKSNPEKKNPCGWTFECETLKISCWHHKAFESRLDFMLIHIVWQLLWHNKFTIFSFTEQIKAPKFTPVGFESHPTKVPSSSSSSSTVSSADQPRTLLPKEPTFQKTHESNPADSSERFMLHESTWKSSDTNNAGSSPHFLTGLSQDTPPATARPNPWPWPS